MIETQPRISDPDGFYAALLAAHDGLTEEQSAALNARLVLVLANQVGDMDVLLNAIEVAAQSANGATSG